MKDYKLKQRNLRASHTLGNIIKKKGELTIFFSPMLRVLKGRRVCLQIGRNTVALDHGCMFSVACPLALQGLNRGKRWMRSVEPGRNGRVVRFALEGNIASGKSTLLELIRTEFKVFTGQW